MRKLQLLIVLLLGVSELFAQGPPPPPPPPPMGCVACIPIDQGAVALIIGALLLGGYQLYRLQQKRSAKS